MSEVAKPAGASILDATQQSPPRRRIKASRLIRKHNMKIFILFEFKISKEDELPTIRRIEFGPEARRKWCTTVVLCPKDDEIKERG
jgi:hypothetical protein